jgi:hypothetical protein
MRLPGKGAGHQAAFVLGACQRVGDLCGLAEQGICTRLILVQAGEFGVAARASQPRHG